MLERGRGVKYLPGDNRSCIGRWNPGHLAPPASSAGPGTPLLAVSAELPLPAASVGVKSAHSFEDAWLVR